MRPVATFRVVGLTSSPAGGRRPAPLGISFDTARDFEETERDFMVTMSRLCAQALERASL